MQLTVNEFYQLTPRQFFNALNGYRRKEENKHKFLAVLLRDIEFAVVQPYLDKKYSNYTAAQYKPFEWEVKTTDKEEKRTFKNKAERLKFWQNVDKQNGR